MSIEQAPKSFKPDPVNTSNNQVPNKPQFIPGEINMSRLPFFASGTKGLKSKTIEYRTIKHLRGGGTLEMTWIVAGNSRYGHPGPFAEKVHHVIETLAFEQGYPISNPIVVNLTEVCRRLSLLVWDKKKKRMVVQSRDRKRVKEALRAIRATLIVCEQAVRLDGRFQSLDDDSNLYAKVLFKGDARGDGTVVEHSEVWLADWYLGSLNAGYYRPIDYSLVLALSDISGAAPKLYKYLAYQFTLKCFRKGGMKEDFVDVPYSEITKIIDISEETAISLAKQRFEKVHRALLDVGFIEEPVEWIGEGRSALKYSIRYIPGQKARRDYKDGRKAIDSQYQLNLFQLPEGSPIAVRLAEIGVDNDGIKRIINGFTEEQIRSQIEHYDWKVMKGEKPKTPGGWMYNAITKPYKIPAGVEQMKAEQSAAIVRQQTERLREESQLKEEADKKKNEQRYKSLDMRLKASSNPDSLHAQVGQLIRENASDFELQMLREGRADITSAMFRSEYYRRLEILLDGGGH